MWSAGTYVNDTRLKNSQLLANGMPITKRDVRRVKFFYILKAYAVHAAIKGYE